MPLATGGCVWQADTVAAVAEFLTLQPPEILPQVEVRAVAVVMVFPPEIEYP